MEQDKTGYLQLLRRGGWNVIFLRIITLGIVYQMFVFLAFPLTVKVMVEYLGQRVAGLELQKENIRLELNLLKAQVNPHFLFNTLNNVYALILNDKKDQSAETVARLSTFLRYTLYEANNHSNNVMNEINLLKDYISLEQIRLNNTVVNFTSSVDEVSHALPPLLFMPAIENAFKFCSEPLSGDAYIFISFNILQGKLEFRVSNSYLPGSIQHIAPGGIGLENLQKRLTHHYAPKQYSFRKSAADGIFMIHVQINLG